MDNTISKKEKVNLTPEEMFNIFMECSSPQAPIKQIMERYRIKPWHLVEIRKRIKEASLEALAQRKKRKTKNQSIPFDQYQKVNRELDQAKEALAAVGHELALLKKKVN